MKTKEAAVHLSSKKLGAIKKLSIPGIRVSDGYDYVLTEYIQPETTLDEVRKRLASIKTPLSEDIVQDRNK